MSTSHYEWEYQNLILAEANNLFPGFITVNGRLKFSADDLLHIPDFYLVDKLYREWWAIEVEMAHHNLAHVLSQVECFALGDFNTQEVVELAAHNSNLDASLFEIMLKGRHPRVAVIVNQPCPAWEPAIRRLGARLLCVQVFRSDFNDMVMQASGEFPKLSANLISMCRIDPFMPRLLVLDSPAAVHLLGENPLRILFDQQLTEWEYLMAKNRAWLSPLRSNPIQSGEYGLFREADGHLSLVTSSSKRSKESQDAA